jgi:glucan phosphoethanolaminetransferase (alkaline phosphatase superfamily)
MDVMFLLLAYYFYSMIFVILFSTSIRVVAETQNVHLFEYLVITLLMLLWPIAIIIFAVFLFILNPVIIPKQK